MAIRIRASSASDANTFTQQKLAVDGLATPAPNYYQLDLENLQTGQKFNAKVNGGGTVSAGYYTTAFTFTGLSHSTRYQYMATVKRYSSSPVEYYYVYFTTPTKTITSPPSRPTITLSGSADPYTGSQSFNISYGDDTDAIHIDRGWSTEVSSGVYSTTAGSFINTQTGIPSGSNRIRVRASNSAGYSTYSAYRLFTMPTKPAPDRPSLTLVGSPNGSSQTFRISHGAYTDRVYFDRSWDTETFSTVSTNSASSFTNTQSRIPPGTHTLRVRAYNGNYSSYSVTVTFTIVDMTNPVLTLNLDGYNAITATMTSSDDSGQFRTERYSMYIDGVYQGRTDSNVYTFDRDKDGKLLKTGQSYTIMVHLYDRAGNYATVSKNIVVTRKRPDNMVWESSKNGGGAFSINATEWNRLTNRINEFRQYRGLDTLVFTTARRGNSITAAIYNEVRDGYSGLTTPISPPSRKNAGNPINGSDIDRFRTSINSVV